jgi:diguanylate cyclase (GGDEF)-like protein
MLPSYTDRDHLTGALSRATLHEQIEQFLQQAQQTQLSFALCLFDLDYFKSINDAYGHVRGDQALIEMVQRVSYSIRADDLLFRYGGDEFIVLMPAANRAQAMNIAERLLAAIRMTPFSGVPPLHLSASIGLVCYPDDAATADRLFQLADERNAAAKRRGRAQIVAYEDETYDYQPILENSRLIERDLALHAVSQLLHELAEQRHAALRLVGLPGSGRTAVIDHAAMLARLRGCRVVRIVGNMARGLAQLEITDSSASHVLLALDRVDDPIVLANWLRRACQYATIGLIYTSTSDDRAVLPANSIPERQVMIEPLSPAGVRVWVRFHLHWEPSDEVVRVLREASAGLPAKLREAVDQLAAQGVLHYTTAEGWSYRPQSAVESHSPIMPARSRLPHVLTSLVGREQEQQAVTTLLHTARLVTLTGPGGIGKTRLALGVARSAELQFAHGVYFVSLALINESSLAIAEICNSLGVAPFPGERPLDGLIRVINDRSMLLVLDNLEQVLGVAAHLTELLVATPKLRLLVTSREVLRLYGEQIYRVPPLETQQPTGQDVLSPAVQLFLQRARAARSDYTADAEQIHQISEICQHLDGLPLAIELAAARAKSLTVREMLAQIHSRLQLLSQGPRDLPSRQQTIRAAIAWSYRLLSRTERLMFVRLSVFADSWTSEAAVAICADATLPSGRIAALIESLAAKSLVQMLPLVDGRMRYRMLETIREYALDRSTDRHQWHVWLQRHANYFLALAERANSHAYTPNSPRWMALLSREYADIRAAMEWAIEQRHPQAQRFGSALWRYWGDCGKYREGRDWLAAIIEQFPIPTIPALERSGLTSDQYASLYSGADILLGMAMLAWYQDDYDQLAPMLEQCIALWRYLGDNNGLSMSLNCKGLVAREQGQYPQARSCFIESRKIAIRMGDRRSNALMLMNMSITAFYRNSLPEARWLIERSHAEFAAIEDAWGVAVTIEMRGEIASANGDYEEAIQYLQEGNLRAQATGDFSLLAHSLNAISEAYYAIGRTAEALTALKQCITICQELSLRDNLAFSLQIAARMALDMAEYARAAQLLGAAAHIREVIGIPVHVVRRAHYNAIVGALQHALGSAAFQALQHQGRALPYERLL